MFYAINYSKFLNFSVVFIHIKIEKVIASRIKQAMGWPVWLAYFQLVRSNSLNRQQRLTIKRQPNVFFDRNTKTIFVEKNVFLGRKPICRQIDSIILDDWKGQFKSNHHYYIHLPFFFFFSDFYLNICFICYICV